MKEPKKLLEAKKKGLVITDIDIIRDSKLSDFIEKTEGRTYRIDEAYRDLGIGTKPKDKKLLKRYNAARKRLRNKGLL